MTQSAKSIIRKQINDKIKLIILRCPSMSSDASSAAFGSDAIHMQCICSLQISKVRSMYPVYIYSLHSPTSIVHNRCHTIHSRREYLIKLSF